MCKWCGYVMCQEELKHAEYLSGGDWFWTEAACPRCEKWECVVEEGR